MQCYSFTCMFGPLMHNQDQIDDIAWTGGSRLISGACSLQCKGRTSQSGDVPAEVLQNLCCTLARKKDWQWRSTYLEVCSPVRLAGGNILWVNHLYPAQTVSHSHLTVLPRRRHVEPTWSQMRLKYQAQWFLIFALEIIIIFYFYGT